MEIAHRQPAGASSGHPRHVSPRLRVALWLTIFLAPPALIHSATHSYFDGDTAYHIAVTRLMIEHGVLHEFPWTPFSWLATHYADKDFLFHVFLIPFAELPPWLAARIAGMLLGCLVLATLYFILSSERVPSAGWWALLSLASSSAFVHRFALVRPHLFAIPLALVIAWSSCRRRLFLLAAACFLFPLFYIAWHLPLALMVIVEAVRLASGHELRLRPLAIGAAALAGGILVHPNFPENLRLFWIQNVDVLLDTVWAGKQGFQMGGEFEPFPFTDVLRYVLLPALLALFAVVLSWRERNRLTTPLGLGVCALAFLAVTLRTQRFIEYLAPFATLAFALSPASGRKRWPPLALAMLGTVWIFAVAWHPIQLLVDRPAVFSAKSERALQAIIPPGEQVVTCDWEFTGEMLLALPGRRFVVALDPVFFAVQDEERYRLWFETFRNPPANPGEVLRGAFGARFVVCVTQPKWIPIFDALAADPTVTQRGIHGYWIVFELTPKTDPGTGS